MKAFGCILISALAIIALVPTSGFEVIEPLYGRSFNLFNLLTSPQAILSRLTSLTSRFAILQSTVDILSSQFTALQTLVRSLQAQITALQQKSCPVSGGTIISDKCYTVRSATGLSWAGAQANCAPVGGALAEPLPSAAASQALYQALKNNAQNTAAFATIEVAVSPSLWIGYKTLINTDPNVVAQIAGTAVDYTPLPPPPPPNPIFLTPQAADPATGLAAAMNAPGGITWNLFDPTATTPVGYICQYNLV